MRVDQRYPRDLAEHVHEYLLSQAKEAPHLEVLELLFENLFFASLRHEEGQPISCRVAFIPRENPDPDPPQRIVAYRWQVIPLATDLPFSVATLVKLSKAVDPWASTIAVDVNNMQELRIWGLVDQSVHYNTFVVKETDIGPQMPGLFQASIQGIGEVSVYSTYVFIGTLRQQTLIKDQPDIFSEGPIREKLNKSLDNYRLSVRSEISQRQYTLRNHWDSTLAGQWFSNLSRILISIQRYGHGGALLLSDQNHQLSSKYRLRYTRLTSALIKQGSLSIQSTKCDGQVIWASSRRRWQKNGFKKYRLEEIVR